MSLCLSVCLSSCVRRFIIMVSVALCNCVQQFARDCNSVIVLELVCLHNGVRAVLAKREGFQYFFDCVV